MKILILAMFLGLAIVSCKEKKAESNNTDENQKADSSEKMSSTLQKGCYMYDANGNSINLEITEIGTPVEGNLTYSLSGKDKNTGTFRGRLEDDTLIGQYTFQSEGSESSREVAFMFKGEKLVEGYGEMTGEGTAFKNRNSIKYSSTMPLPKTDCTQ